MHLMAKILIIEPHAEVRELLARIVARLGHQAILYSGVSEDTAAGADVVLVEPADVDGLDAARVARASGASVVCVSIFPAADDARGLDPVAYLLKPFSLLDLERAVEVALESRQPILG